MYIDDQVHPELMPPTTTAANIYELLDEIVAAIEAEPKRMYMADWIRLGSYIPDEQRPACGIQGCIAGWVAFKVDGLMKTAESFDRFSSAIQQRASRIIEGGIGNAITYQLFSGEVYIPNPTYDPSADEMSPNSESRLRLEADDPRYVPTVIARIRAFQAAHEPFLRGRTLDQVRSEDAALDQVMANRQKEYERQMADDEADDEDDSDDRSADDASDWEDDADDDDDDDPIENED